MDAKRAFGTLVQRLNELARGLRFHTVGDVTNLLNGHTGSALLNGHTGSALVNGAHWERQMRTAGRGLGPGD